MGAWMGVAPCYACKKMFLIDVECVSSILVDPWTNRPPDLDEHYRNIEPDPTAVDRSIRESLCDPCVMMANVEIMRLGRTDFLTTQEERHESKWRTPLGVHE